MMSASTTLEDASIIVITLLAHITALAEVDINFNLINALAKVSRFQMHIINAHAYSICNVMQIKTHVLCGPRKWSMHNTIIMLTGRAKS